MASFWAQTPRTLKLGFAAKARALLRERNARIELAWNIAALQRQKKLPKLDRLTLKEPKPRQTWEHQYAIAEQWVTNAAKLKEKQNGR